MLLLAVTAIWGATFPMVKAVTGMVPTFWFLAMRFDLATLVVAVLFWRRLWRAPWRTWAAGALIGSFLFAAYALQTFGLSLTTSAKTGFITGLSVVLVPVVSLVWLRRAPEPQAWAGVLLALGGLALMTLSGSLVPALGDLLVFGCAVGFALHVVSVARFAGQHDPTVLTVAQMGVAALLSHLASALTETGPAVVPPYVWWAVFFTGFFCSAVAFWLQNTLQPFTTPTHTALVFAAEPVWAALFAWLLGGEAITARLGLGGALILAGMLLAELPLPGPRRHPADL